MIIAIDDNTILQVKSQRRGHTALQIGILNGLSHRLVEFMHKLLESRLGRGLLLKCARGPARTSTDEKASVQRPDTVRSRTSKFPLQSRTLSRLPEEIWKL
jgi:hypothetical protein